MTHQNNKASQINKSFDRWAKPKLCPLFLNLFQQEWAKTPSMGPTLTCSRW